jgi:hypothetical protein
MTPPSTQVATQRLTAEEQAVYDFISDDLQNARRFMEHVAAAKTTDVRAAAVTQIAEAEASLQTTYSNRLAQDLVDGRTHILERTYESMLRSMLFVSANMKAALAAPTKVLAVAAMEVALREVPRLARRVEWTTHELDALTAYMGGNGARPRGHPARRRGSRDRPEHHGHEPSRSARMRVPQHA